MHEEPRHVAMEIAATVRVTENERAYHVVGRWLSDDGFGVSYYISKHVLAADDRFVVLSNCLEEANRNLLELMKERDF